jgi:hypothetical protein
MRDLVFLPSEIPSKFFFSDEFTDQIDDFLVIGSEIFEFYECLYCLFSFTSGYKCLSIEPENLWVTRVLFQVTFSVGIDIF